MAAIPLELKSYVSASYISMHTGVVMTKGRIKRRINPFF